MIEFKESVDANGVVSYTAVAEGKAEIEIPAKGKVSPFRLTEQDIVSKVKNVTFTVMPSGKAVICEVILANGFTVRGESAVVDPKNFVLEIGQKISFSHAIDKVWEVEGYLMQQKKYESELN